MEQILLYNKSENAWIRIEPGTGPQGLSMSASPNAVGWVSDTWKRYMGINIPVAEVVASLMTHGFVPTNKYMRIPMSEILSYLSATEANRMFKNAQSAKKQMEIIDALHDNNNLWERWYRRDFGDPAIFYGVFRGNVHLQYAWVYHINRWALDLICKYIMRDAPDYIYSVVDIKTIRVENRPYMSKEFPVSEFYRHLRITSVDDGFAPAMFVLAEIMYWENLKPYIDANTMLFVTLLEFMYLRGNLSKGIINLLKTVVTESIDKHLTEMENLKYDYKKLPPINEYSLFV